MRRAGVAACALAVLLAAGGARAQALPSSVVDQPPPPAPRFETIPPPPAPGLVWASGRWRWDGTAWRWSRGRYRSRLLARDTYIRGYWQQHAGTGFGWSPGAMK
jgi:hypothetical protein